MASECIATVDDIAAAQAVEDIADDACVAVPDVWRVLRRLARHKDGALVLRWIDNERIRLSNEQVRKSEAAEEARRRARGEIG
jgi:hypothetical protein